MASLVAIFLIPVSFYVVERLASASERAPRRRRPAAPRPTEATGIVTIAILRSRCSRLCCVAGCAVGPNYRRPPIDATGRHARADRSGRSRVARRPPVVGGVRRSRFSQGWSTRRSRHNHDLAAAVDARRAGAPAGRRGACRSLPADRLPGPGGAAADRSSPGLPNVDRQHVPRRLQPRLGDRHLGPHPARHRVGARAVLRHRGLPARRAAHAGERRGAGVLRAARARPRARDLPARPPRPSRTPSTLFTRRYEGGVGTLLEVARGARGARRRRRRPSPSFESRIVAKENQICVLLGRNPGPIPRGRPLDRRRRCRRPCRSASRRSSSSAGPTCSAGGAGRGRRQRRHRRRGRQFLPARSA